MTSTPKISNWCFIELFKSLNHIGPKIIWYTFEIRDTPFNLRQKQTIRTLHANKSHERPLLLCFTSLEQIAGKHLIISISTKHCKIQIWFV